MTLPGGFPEGPGAASNSDDRHRGRLCGRPAVGGTFHSGRSNSIALNPIGRLGIDRRSVPRAAFIYTLVLFPSPRIDDRDIVGQPAL